MKSKPFKDRHRPVEEIRNWRHQERAAGTLHRHKRRVLVLNGCETPVELLEKLVPNDPDLPLGERWETRLRVGAMITAIMEADS